MQLNGRDLISLTETNARLQALITGTQKLTDKFELKLSSREKSMDALKNMISEGRKFKQLTMMDLSPELRETKLSIVLRLFVEAEGFTDYLRAFNMTNCDYVDPEGFVIFLKQFPKLESIKLDNIKFFSSNRNFPIIPTNTYDPHIILNLGFLPYMVPKFEHLKSLIIITSNSDTLSVSCSKIFQNAVQLENISTNSFFISFITDYSNLKSVRIDNTTYRTNFFTDDIQKRIKFRLKSFAYRGIRFQSVPGRDNVSRFLSKQTEITELSLHIGNVSNAVLKQIVMMPQLKKLNVRHF